MAGVAVVKVGAATVTEMKESNACVEGAIVVDTVKGLRGARGFNAQTEEYEELLQAGILDPTKLVRRALQNAASVAALLLTTEVMIAEKPAEKKGGGSMPDMGGIDDMP